MYYIFQVLPPLAGNGIAIYISGAHYACSYITIPYLYLSDGNLPSKKSLARAVIEFESSNVRRSMLVNTPSPFEYSPCSLLQ